MIPVVLYGQTGSGKTNLLRELHNRNFAVIDLEDLARHRGSVFGRLNMSSQQPSQSNFEENIAHQLQNFYDRDFVFVEHEASNIGKLRLPHTVTELYREGLPVQIKTSFERRVANILQEYLPADQGKLVQALEKLKERLPMEFFAELNSLLVNKQYHSFCSAMLSYYDQSKQYRPVRPYAFLINDQGAEANADHLIQWLNNHVVASDRNTGSTLS